MASDYFQQVVHEYLRSSRSRFVNSECLIQLDEGTPKRQRHWYCDFMTVDFSTSSVYLCEVTFSRTCHSLLKRLASWATHWPAVTAAIQKDCRVPTEWQIAPWLFVPELSVPLIRAKLQQRPDETPQCMPQPAVTTLESVVPWKYRSWNGLSYEE